MARQSSILLIIGLVGLLGFGAKADQNRFMVFFADKAESIYSIDAPLDFLSQKAIDRRVKVNQAITVQDLPVNANYLDSLIKYNVTPYYTSKWFNAALVEADSADLDILITKDFVLSYEYIAPGTRLNPVTQPYTISFNPLEPSIVSSNSKTQIEMLGAQTMHAQGYTGEGVHVAVLDGGFQKVDQSAIFKHIFNNGRLKDRMDFTTNSENVFDYDDHGSNVLSCMAGNYKTVLIGTGYDMDVSLYVTEDVSNNSSFEYRIEEYNWLLAAERADSVGVDIIASSLGYSTFLDTSMNYTIAALDGKTAVISKAADLASQKGILVVCSAGNEGNGSWRYITMPADVESVVTVGAISSNGNKSSFSSIGPTADGRTKPDVVALGQGVSVFHQNNTIGTNNGTSFSSPLIAGLAAGIWQQFPELTNVELKELILSIGDNHNNPDNSIGHGLPNYRRLINDSILSVKKVFDESFTVYPNPFTGDHISILIEREYSRQDLDLKLYAPDGKLVAVKFEEKVKKGDIINLEVKEHSKGLYVLRLQSGGELKNVKLLRY
ncbi:S8 family serine peptidase [Reichenbachiella agarivorans]|uniref:S8 family serine peptidase n=1 Tax=Reichenbachiella agarivorans TaxID=2979464 RepID=A0ABY6CNH3_9BACT|nr:S8 family serine peptidase [Reichenbachiella agarivorans]UXP31585.1 S8 family serine peptidase [Reichenbachiella agarivorans]